MNETRYPVYVLSKGRADCCLTARCFTRDRLRFFLVVEAQEEQEYRKYYPHAEYLILPPEATGQGAVRVRQWIWEHSSELGAERHWEFDDNIREIGRLNKGYRIKCQAGIALNVIEDFTDRYTNIAIAGLNYQMFVINTTSIPYYLNCHVYSAMLIKNNIPCRWRLRYNADTDLCLQALTSNWCQFQCVLWRQATDDENEGRQHFTVSRRWPADHGTYPRRDVAGTCGDEDAFRTTTACHQAQLEAIQTTIDSPL